ncbi:MAG TPA: BNR-4 repeat-containing protein, partial [Lacipirellulaceae bacterium]|nr:BNR-4 repeat-containing protein [Lacipirellulaceae bacterium]
GAVDRVVLHPQLEQDDHNNPAFWVRPDGRYLAVYTKHGQDRIIRWRISEPGNPLAWGPEQTLETPGTTGSFSGDSVTYSNVFKFPDGKLYDFHRSFDLDPNYVVSEDDGATWRYGGRLLHGRDGYSPYLKYAYDGQGKLHFVATEDHPRNFDNSLYHGYVSEGQLYNSAGEQVAPLSTSTEVSARAWDFTKLFAGDPDHVAWMCDIELDGDRRPCVAFTTQRDGRGLGRGEGGADMRFHLARFDGAAWHSEEIAYAGTRLYPGEDDYTGLAALDPDDPTIVYISTDADPKSGAPLVSRADGKRRHELYRGRREPGAAAWTWTPLTANSTGDNLRPIVPKRNNGQTALVWMRGEYRNNRGEWTTAVAAMPLEPLQETQ